MSAAAPLIRYMFRQAFRTPHSVNSSVIIRDLDRLKRPEAATGAPSARSGTPWRSISITWA